RKVVIGSHVVDSAGTFDSLPSVSCRGESRSSHSSSLMWGRENGARSQRQDTQGYLGGWTMGHGVLSVTRRAALLGMLSLFILCGFRCGFTGLPDAAAQARSAKHAAYPIRVSANGRYLVDQNGVPFLITGDSPQSMMTLLTLKQDAHYFSVRE